MSPRTRRVSTESTEQLPTRYRAIVLASDPCAAFRHVGGWLCDHALAGWDALIASTVNDDAGPARILGASTTDLAVVISSYDPTNANVVAVEGALYDAHAGVRRFVDTVALGRFNEVVLWGESTVSGETRFHSAEHPLTLAARAFKLQACLSVCRPGAQDAAAVAAVERFRRTGNRGPGALARPIHARSL